MDRRIMNPLINTSKFFYYLETTWNDFKTKESVDPQLCQQVNQAFEKQDYPQAVKGFTIAWNNYKEEQAGLFDNLGIEAKNKLKHKETCRLLFRESNSFSRSNR